MDAQAELEESVIGAILIRNDTLALLPDLTTITFHGMKARATWEAIRNLEHKHQPIDITTIGDELARAGKLEAVGFDYLGLCATRVPTPQNAVEYARRLQDASLRRRLLETLSEVISCARGGQETGAELLSMALAGLSTLDAEQPEDARMIGDVVRQRIEQLEVIAKERAEGRTDMTGFPTGVSALDDKIGGWQPGIVSIVAARPGMGKSSLGLATADACSNRHLGVHLFSLEDTEQAYADRTISRTSKVPAEDIRNCNLKREHLDHIQHAVMRLRSRKNWLVDSRSGITADEIVRSVRRRRRDNNTRVVIVDYIQLVKRPPRESPHEALSNIVTTFADAAKQDNVAYVVMSQLNRQLESRTDKRPQLSDLRESGSLEERAKCVVALYRGSVYGGDPVMGIDFAEGERRPSAEEFQRMAHVLVLKNSNGRTGAIRAAWDGPTTRIS